jgi:hypothetical protein
MRKTSVYLAEAESRRLARLAVHEGRSQADIIRDAVRGYEPAARDEGDFQVFDTGDGPGDAIAAMDDDELLAGFGR